MPKRSATLAASRCSFIPATSRSAPAANEASVSLLPVHTLVTRSMICGNALIGFCTLRMKLVAMLICSRLSGP